MSEPNFFCQASGCHNHAEFFGFIANAKLTCCSQHISLLSHKHSPLTYYNSISSAQDLLTLEIKDITAKEGLHNLAMLRDQCEAEKEASIEALEKAKMRLVKIVERCFHEAEHEVVSRYDTILNALASIEEQFENFRKLKSAELDENATVLSNGLAHMPKLIDTIIADCALGVAMTICNSLKHNREPLSLILQSASEANCQQTVRELLEYSEKEVKAGQIEFAIGAVKCALSLGASASLKELQNKLKLKQRLVCKELMSMFTFSVDEDEVKTVILWYFDDGRAAIAEFRYNYALEKLKIAWSLATKHKLWDKEIYELCLELGDALSLNFTNFSDAENVLKQGLEMESQSSSNQDSVITIRVRIARVFLYSCQYRKAKASGRDIMHEFKNMSIDNYWEAVYIRFWAYYRMDMLGKAANIFRKALPNYGIKGSLKSQILRKIMNIVNYELQEDYQREKMKIDDLFLLVQDLPPNSIFRAIAFALSACIYRREHNCFDALSLRLKAQEIYSTHFPDNSFSARNHFRISELYSEVNSPSPSLDYLKTAPKINSHFYRNSPDNTKTLYKMALLAEQAQNFDAAKDRLMLALQILGTTNASSPYAVFYLSALVRVHRARNDAESEREQLGELMRVLKKRGRLRLEKAVHEERCGSETVMALWNAEKNWTPLEFSDAKKVEKLVLDVIDLRKRPKSPS